MASDSAVAVADDVPVASLGTANKGLLLDLRDKIHARINQGMEGEVLSGIKAHIGVDPESLLLEQSSSSWAIGLLAMSIIFWVGGLVEAKIHLAERGDDSFGQPLAIQSPRDLRHPSHHKLKAMRRPLLILILLELVFLIMSLPYTPLTLTLPIVSLHQVSRVVGLAMNGRAVGGNTMRLGIVGILIGTLLTTLLGIHESLEPHAWKTIMAALWSPLFGIWTFCLLVVVFLSLIIAFVSPLESHADTEYDEPSSLLVNMASFLRMKACVFIFQTPVSSQLKRHAFSASTGILAALFLIIVQQFSLTIATNPSVDTLIGFQTFFISFCACLYTMVCGYVFSVALQKFDSTQFLPATFCWIVIVGTVTELLLQLVCYEREGLTLIRIIMYSVGLGSICAGLLSLGAADVRQQLENLQYLASEVSRLGVVIEGTFLEASGSSPTEQAHRGYTTPKLLELGLGFNGSEDLPPPSMDISHIKLDFETVKADPDERLLSDIDYDNLKPFSTEDDFKLDLDDVSQAFELDGDNNSYVHTILSDLNMPDTTL